MSTHAHWFDAFTERVAESMGRPKVFTVALVFVALWAVSGPFLGFSDTWQLLINTSTTVLTFLMVFLLQNTQNRDSKAIHAKLDELIKGTDHARDDFRHIETKPVDEIDMMVADFENEGGGTAISS